MRGHNLLVDSLMHITVNPKTNPFSAALRKLELIRINFTPKFSKQRIVEVATLITSWTGSMNISVISYKML